MGEFFFFIALNVYFIKILKYIYNFISSIANKQLYHCKPLKHYVRWKTECTAIATKINNHQLYQGAPTISCVSVSITFF